MQDLAPIARRIVDGFDHSPEEGHAAIAEYLAPTVQIAHEPPNPMDGPVPAALMRGGAQLELQAFRKGLKDFRAQASSRIDGDSLTLDFAYLGVANDGAPVSIPLSCVLDVADGRIVRVLARASDQARTTLGRLLAEAGVTPESFAALAREAAA